MPAARRAAVNPCMAKRHWADTHMALVQGAAEHTQTCTSIPRHQQLAEPLVRLQSWWQAVLAACTKWAVVFGHHSSSICLGGAAWLFNATNSTGPAE
jgi:hypothetical protein